MMNGVHVPEPRSSGGNTSSNHYNDVTMGTMASQINSLTIVYSIVYSDADQRKHQSSASLAFVWGIHRGPVNSPHKWSVTWKMFPFDDVIMTHSTHIRFLRCQSREKNLGNVSHESTKKIRRYNKSQTKPYAYFMGYTTLQTRLNFNPSMDK